MKLQSYHTELLKVLFSAEDDGRTAPTEVAFAVTETRVRVTISVRRVVQCVPTSQLHEPTEIVAASDAQGQVLSSEHAADGPAKVPRLYLTTHTRVYTPLSPPRQTDTVPDRFSWNNRTSSMCSSLSSPRHISG